MNTHCLRVEWTSEGRLAQVSRNRNGLRCRGNPSVNDIGRYLIELLFFDAIWQNDISFRFFFIQLWNSSHHDRVSLSHGKADIIIKASTHSASCWQKIHTKPLEPCCSFGWRWRDWERTRDRKRDKDLWIIAVYQRVITSSKSTSLSQTGRFSEFAVNGNIKFPIYPTKNPESTWIKLNHVFLLFLNRFVFGFQAENNNCVKKWNKMSFPTSYIFNRFASSSSSSSSLTHQHSNIDKFRCLHKKFEIKLTQPFGRKCDTD